MKRIGCLVVCLLAVVVRVEAANRTVCASGCQYTSLQAAIDAAVPGDVIRLRAGETFTGNFILRAKSASSTAYITIRSDAPDSSLPGSGVRLIPEGRPGANVARAALARLVGRGGTWRTTAVIRTEPGAHHYRLQFLDIDGGSNDGYGAVVDLGANGSTQTTMSSAPHSLVLDRVYMHGSRTKGMRRGIALNSRTSDVLNSYIVDIMHLEDAQAIGGYNGPGPFRIINNHLEATGENIMFGGADPKISNLVPSDIQIRGNYLTKPVRWRNPVLTAPKSVTLTATTGGALAAGTHYFKVVAMMKPGGRTVVSAPSTEIATTVGSSGAVKLTWAAVSGADSYRVYRGTSSNGQNVYVSTAGATTSLTYTGSGQTSGTPKSSGTKWTVKNLLEFKNAQRVTVSGNLFEHNWAAAQDGAAVLLTPRNQNGTAPWVVVRDITFTNNIVRRVASAIRMLGRDYNATSQQTTNIRIVNNVFEVDTTYGGSGRFFVVTGGPSNITFDHNTILNTGTIVYVDSAPIPGFVYTNNMSRHNTYGIDGPGTSSGTATLTKFFPNAVFRANVLAGGKASSYPSGNHFPTTTQFDASFVNRAAGDYSLVSTSPYNNAGTDGRDIGVNMPALAEARFASSGAAGTSPGTSPDPADDPPVSGGGSVGGGAETSLPAGWKSEDIGAVGAAGAASANAGSFTLKGAGSDIWGSTDSFHFAYRTLTGDGSIVARVASVAGSDAWTKMGVMIRASNTPGAAHAYMLVSAGKGLAFQRRKTASGLTTHTSGGGGTAPRWVRLTRQGSVIVASASADGLSWTEVGRDTIVLPQDVLIGLAGTSHDSSVLATGTFDRVTVSAGAGLPAGWQSQDVGNVGRTGSTTASGGTFTVRGAGADVWGAADAFQFAFRTLSGDGSIVARVATLSGTEPWTKAGVMIRMTLDAGSPHAFLLVSAGKGLAFQRRTIAGGLSAHTAAGTGTAPRWLKLTRRGQLMTAAVSSNGSTWTTVGQDTLSIAGPVHVGLAVTSHDASRLATATFDNVSVTAAP